MSLVYCDSFDHYQSAESYLKWDIGSAPVANVGRRGTQGLNWNKGGIARNIGNQTTAIIGMAVFAASSDLDTISVKHNGTPVANTLTSKCYLFGLGYQGVSQIGVAFTNDGALHIVRGGAFDLSSSEGGVNILASTAAGVLPLTGWAFVEGKFIAATGGTGTAIVRVNGQVVLNQTAVQTTRPTGGLPALYTQLFIGGPSFGGLEGAGWAGRIDDLYVFNAAGTTNNDFIGDVRVEYRKPNGAGNASDSTIQGSTPAPTRWQSVDDQLPDGEVTYVSLEAIDDADSYAHEDLPFDEADVYAVQHVAAARKSDAGLTAIKATQRVNSLDDQGPERYPAGGEFAYQLTPFDESADGAWTLAKFNDSEFGVQRVVVP